MLFSNIIEGALHKLDVTVRRKLRLGQHFPKLRGWLLEPYRKFINLHGHGVLMNIGGCVSARIPPDYAWNIVEEYEPESVAVLKKWMESVQHPLLVDVGCSVGFISCAGLFSNESSHVVAIDSDAQSLKATQNLCACAPQVGERLSLVLGFVSDKPTDNLDHVAAHRAAIRQLAKAGASGSPDLIRYVCLNTDDAAEKMIAHHTIDDLIPSTAFPGRPIMIKCDVEGAEMLVLKGAQKLLAERDVTVLLSVHPPALPRFGTSKEELRAFLASLDFKIDVVAVDHEEHWWCVKSSSATSTNS
jgi:FkbM family methyltransferase